MDTHFQIINVVNENRVYMLHAEIKVENAKLGSSVYLG